MLLLKLPPSGTRVLYVCDDRQNRIGGVDIACLYAEFTGRHDATEFLRGYPNPLSPDHYHVIAAWDRCVFVEERPPKRRRTARKRREARPWSI